MTQGRYLALTWTESQLPILGLEGEVKEGRESEYFCCIIFRVIRTVNDCKWSTMSLSNKETHIQID